MLLLGKETALAPTEKVEPGEAERVNHCAEEKLFVCNVAVVAKVVEIPVPMAVAEGVVIYHAPLI